MAELKQSYKLVRIPNTAAGWSELETHIRNTGELFRHAYNENAVLEVVVSLVQEMPDTRN